MLFSSLVFLFGFLPLILLFYFLIGNKKIKNVVLLIFSLVFYAWGEPKNILLMLFTVFIVYIFGLIINECENKKDYKNKKIFFIICIVIVLLSLIYFKYTNFILENLNNIFNLNIKMFNIVLPIGISFYTFQILSYIIDLYKGKIKVQKSFINLALYVSFFPQLIAGPIVRYETVEEEINKRKHSLVDVIYGVKRFILGLSKKVIIANQMAILADFVFNNYNLYFGTSIIWIGVLAYTFQIYYDFSGYSDMAIGLGRIFGFHFLENFNFPYISKSITDFWRRWHISLSTWFRDYIYIPLGGNRVNKIKWIRNVFIVWFLTGLWHGASWNFVLWGLYYAIFLLIEKFNISKIENIPLFLRHIFTFTIIMIGWTIFRSNTLNDIYNLLSIMFVYKNTDWANIVSSNLPIFKSLIYFIPAIIFSFPIFENIKHNKISGRFKVALYNFILLILLFICVVFLTSSSYNPFIYFRF